jgi:hypothetical protein
MVTNRAPAKTGPAPASVLFAENQIAFFVDGQESNALKKTLQGMVSQQGAAGSITQIVPTTAQGIVSGGQRPATLGEFFASLNVHGREDLLRALSGDFFFGIHMADTPSPVFIIPVTSYDRAFAGMLAWEQSIDSDLSPLFKLIPSLTTSAEGGLPVQRQFKDLVMRNYDVRALTDDSGAIVLYYSFPTPRILIIAASQYSFTEVLSRLQAERKL